MTDKEIQKYRFKTVVSGISPCSAFGVGSCPVKRRNIHWEGLGRYMHGSVHGHR